MGEATPLRTGCAYRLDSFARFTVLNVTSRLACIDSLADLVDRSRQAGMGDCVVEIFLAGIGPTVATLRQLAPMSACPMSGTRIFVHKRGKRRIGDASAMLIAARGPLAVPTVSVSLAVVVQQPRRNIALGVENTPDLDLMLAHDVEDQMRVPIKRP